MGRRFSYSSRKASSNPSHTSGFTLLEVLVASFLVAVLLAGLWSLFSTYIKLFDTGERQTARARLVQAMMQQLSDDIDTVLWEYPDDLTASMTSAPTASVAPAVGSINPASGGSTLTTPADVPATTSATITTSLRPTGMYGTSDYLRLDILQLRPPRVVKPEEINSTSLNSDSKPDTPPLFVVEYFMLYPEDLPQTSGGRIHGGLVRRETPWHLFHGQMDYTSPDTDSLNRQGSKANQTMGSTFSEPTSPRQIVISEVEKIRFRFFDGTQWLDQWDSTSQPVKPQAVEISFFVTSGMAEDDTKLTDSIDTSPASLANLGEKEIPTYRLVIALTDEQKDVPSGTTDKAPFQLRSLGSPDTQGEVE